MAPLEQGMSVFSIDDRRVGQVSKVRDCCFDVMADGEPFTVLHDGVFNIDEGRVSLMCVGEELARYACRQHTLSQAG